MGNKNNRNVVYDSNISSSLRKGVKQPYKYKKYWKFNLISHLKHDIDRFVSARMKFPVSIEAL